PWLEPWAGDRVHGGPRADAPGLPGQRGRPLHHHARPGPLLPDREPRARAPSRRRPPSTRPALRAPGIPRRRAPQRGAADPRARGQAAAVGGRRRRAYTDVTSADAARSIFG